MKYKAIIRALMVVNQNISREYYIITLEERLYFLSAAYKDTYKYELFYTDCIWCIAKLLLNRYSDSGKYLTS